MKKEAGRNVSYYFQMSFKQLQAEDNKRYQKTKEACDKHLADLKREHGKSKINKQQEKDGMLCLYEPKAS